MQLSSDIVLYNPIWARADEELCTSNVQQDIFGRLIDIYVVACAIGIRDDKVISDRDSDKTSESREVKTIGRNTHRENTDIRDLLDLMLQIALIRSNTIDFSSDERLKLAFNPEYEIKNFRASDFLTGFANYGITKIYENDLQGESLITIEQLHSYFDSLCNSKLETEILSLLASDSFADESDTQE